MDRVQNKVNKYKRAAEDELDRLEDTAIDGALNTASSYAKDAYKTGKSKLRKWWDSPLANKAKNAGIAVLKYGVPLAATAVGAHYLGNRAGLQKGLDLGYELQEKEQRKRLKQQTKAQKRSAQDELEIEALSREYSKQKQQKEALQKQLAEATDANELLRWEKTMTKEAGDGKQRRLAKAASRLQRRDAEIQQTLKNEIEEKKRQYYQQAKQNVVLSNQVQDLTFQSRDFLARNQDLTDRQQRLELEAARQAQEFGRVSDQTRLAMEQLKAENAGFLATTNQFRQEAEYLRDNNKKLSDALNNKFPNSLPDLGEYLQNWNMNSDQQREQIQRAAQMDAQTSNPDLVPAPPSEDTPVQSALVTSEPYPQNRAPPTRNAVRDAQIKKGREIHQKFLKNKSKIIARQSLLPTNNISAVDPAIVAAAASPTVDPTMVAAAAPPAIDPAVSAAIIAAAASPEIDPKTTQAKKQAKNFNASVIKKRTKAEAAAAAAANKLQKEKNKMLATNAKAAELTEIIRRRQEKERADKLSADMTDILRRKEIEEAKIQPARLKEFKLKANTPKARREEDIKMLKFQRHNLRNRKHNNERGVWDNMITKKVYRKKGGNLAWLGTLASYAPMFQKGMQVYGNYKYNQAAQKKRARIAEEQGIDPEELELDIPDRPLFE